MTKAVLGIIGGSGVYDLPGIEDMREERIGSPWGEPSDVLRLGRIGETEVAFFNGSVSENQYEGVLPATGDYKIRVYMMRSAARRNEVANYRLEMIVSGPAHGSASHDALVPGTGYHATAKIPCVAEPDKPMGQCDAGVKRSAGGGTVHISTPDGGSRVITFRDGKVAATDASAPFKVERRDDWTIVRIGTVEVYEIPDALVFGG